MLNLFILFCILQSMSATDIQEDGFSSVSSRIVGGTTAPDGKFPYQCSVLKNGQHKCGCAIIKEQWILTTASCITITGLNGIQILVGTNDLYNGGDRYTPLDFIIHEHYNEPKFANDIALIKVDNILISDKVKPIDVSSKYVKDGINLLFTGWGQTKAKGSKSQHLQLINLRSIKNSKCRQAFKNNKKIVVDDSTLCTLTKAGEGVCNGDLGSPLVLATDTDKYELVGLQSWSIPKCAKGYPDGFSRISYLYDWIQDKTTTKTTIPPGIPVHPVFSREPSF